MKMGALLALLACSGCVRTLINARGWKPIPFEDSPRLSEFSRDQEFLKCDPEELPPYPGPFPSRERKIAPWGAVLFLHGFAGLPEFHLLSLRRLAAEGLLVWAPELPDLNLLFPFGYHPSIQERALWAYDLLAAESARRGLPRPYVMGYSQGGGAALFVAAERQTSAVLWGPTRINGPLPRPQRPVLVVAGSEDCIADRRPEKIAAALHPWARLWRVEGANHLAFTDPLVAGYLDCPAKISHHAQRVQAVRVSADFFRALRRQSPAAKSTP